MPRVNLDHLKPHKPLVRPPITNVTTNINSMVRNNIRFCFTIQIKNRIAREAFCPIAYTSINNMAQYYTELPFERYGLLMSDYEWYLHTTRIKEIYKKQKHFIGVMQRRQAGQNTFLEILQKNDQYEITSPQSLNPGSLAPTIYYVTPKPGTSSASAEQAKATQTNATVINNESHEHISTEVRAEGQAIGTEINIERIVKKAVKAVEEKWQYDRLVKGR